MTYTVQQLADLAGISVRTLHHYDEVGLLTPSRAENGYRSYTRDDLLTLQQILFFRELEVPLEEIKDILARPDFDRIEALKEHRAKLEARRENMAELIATIDKTIADLNGEGTLTDEEMFESFWSTHEQEYKQEAKERWGDTDAYRQSMERTKHMTKDDFKRIAKEGDAFMTEFVTMIDQDPASDEVQAMIKQHYEGLKVFYDPSPEIYRGLAQMYVDDPRFAAYYERYAPNMQHFMRDAMMVFAYRLEE